MELRPGEEIPKPEGGRYQPAGFEERNLNPDLFPMGILPRMTFSGSPVPVATAQDIWVIDCTLGIGAEGLAPWGEKMMVDFYEALHHLGGPRGALRQIECPIGRREELDAISGMLSFEYSFPEVVGWAPVGEERFKTASRLGLRELTVPVPGSHQAVYGDWSADPRERLAQVASLVREAFDVDLVPKLHLTDIARTDLSGWLLPMMQEIRKLSDRAGSPVKIRLVDSGGAGLPHPSVSAPRGVGGLLGLLRERFDWPGEWIEWLGADDLGMADSNGLSAWLGGAAGCAGTVLGLGERAGWARTEVMLAHYVGLRGEVNGVGLKSLQGVTRSLQSAGVELPLRSPLAGGGVLESASPEALLRPEAVFSFDPERVLGRAPVEGIGPGGGLDEVARSVARLLGWGVVDPSHPGVTRLKEWIDAEYAAGRSSSISAAEVASRLPGFFPESDSETAADV